MVTGTALDSALAAYTRRTMPRSIAEGASPPESWVEGPEAWESVISVAREHFAAKAAYDFALEIAERGWRPAELATGELQAGAEISAASGAVVRPLGSDVAPRAINEAQKLKREISDLNLPLDGAIASDLAAIAFGKNVPPKRVEVILRLVTSTIHQARTARQAERAEARSQPLLRVKRAFKALGKSYPTGEYRIGEEEAAGLEEWKLKMQAQAALHDWGAPDGYRPENWPPFDLTR